MGTVWSFIRKLFPFGGVSCVEVEIPRDQYQNDSRVTILDDCQAKHYNDKRANSSWSTDDKTKALVHYSGTSTKEDCKSRHSKSKKHNLYELCKTFVIGSSSSQNDQPIAGITACFLSEIVSSSSVEVATVGAAGSQSTWRCRNGREAISSDTIAYKVVERKIQDYSSLQNILLVGEGDFSFSACLAKAFGSATHMIATSLNSEAYLRVYYSYAKSNILELRRRGCKVLHEVNATDVSNHKSISGISFDRIIYNFPHCGDFRGTMGARRMNQDLVQSFMENSAKLITKDGEIHIRHKSTQFFRCWNLKLLGSRAGLMLIDEAPFDASSFGGYNTKYGFEGRRFRSDYNFDCHPSSTFKFVLQK